MSGPALFQLVALIALLAATIGPLGRYMAKVYQQMPEDPAPGERVFGPIDRAIYRVCGIDPKREQRWNVYALSLLAFSFVSVLVVYAAQRFQGALPLNPNDRAGVNPWGAFNTAVSFVTNTNWQWYSGEQTMSHLTQMLALTVQNFVSAAAGMAVAVAIIRGIARKNRRTLGNFWVDLVRSTTRILMPLALVFAVFFVSQGVIQNFKGSTTAKRIDQTVQITDADGVNVAADPVQNIVGGPFASQEAIKELGTNGGGPLNANSAHPFENPNAWTNFFQIYLLLLIPFSFTVAFGYMVGSKRQGRVLLVVMMALWLVSVIGVSLSEQSGNPKLDSLGVNQSASSQQVGGNFEGKEVRFGAGTCGLYAGSTTSTSTGAVNCMHDSLTPLGGM
ncbi:MAG: potassium-transporting ATPase subunit KdpA, partial [Acidimicrobiia bacterium]